MENTNKLGQVKGRTRVVTISDKGRIDEWVDVVDILVCKYVNLEDDSKSYWYIEARLK